ncbi:hypothetical protein DY000_02007595 [Brassica cretica]|uniref:Uncharacterized protein n=1 Tax=Brassica cretica TaxID=69181 RepID=A0ABQ7CDU5_BRACR|nr:hypothetical protein DY000_02007595 [Brassica cretica]
MAEISSSRYRAGTLPGLSKNPQKRSSKLQTPPSTTDSRVQGSITKTWSATEEPTLARVRSTTLVYKGSKIQILRTLSCLRGSHPIILDAPSTDFETPREKELPNTKEVATDLEEEEERVEEDVEIDRQERINVDQHTTVNIDRQCGNNVNRRLTPAEPAMERVYRTLPPFPPNKTQTKRELNKAICKKAFKKITLEMPLSDAIKRK